MTYQTTLDRVAPMRKGKRGFSVPLGAPPAPTLRAGDGDRTASRVPLVARGSSRIPALFAGGCAGLVLALALLSPPVGAASLGPPYRGASVQPTSSAFWAGCSKVQQPTSPTWAPSSGRGVFSSVAKSTTCPRSPFGSHVVSSFAQWYGGWDLLVPVRLLAHAAPQSVNASWSFAWTVSTVYAVQHPCAGTLAPRVHHAYLDCSADASSSFYLISYLVDTTANAYYFSGVVFPSVYNFSYAYNDTYCNPTCSASNYSTPSAGPTNGSTAFTFHIALNNANASHRWELGVVAGAHTYASVTTDYLNFTAVTPLSATARASLDTASGTNGAVLTAIVVR